MGKKSWERLCEEREFNAFYQALAQQSGFEQIGRFLQHGSTTRLMHSVAVAYYSYRLAKITRLSFHWEEMVRGGFASRLLSLRRPGRRSRTQVALDPSPRDCRRKRET